MTVVTVANVRRQMSGDDRCMVTCDIVHGTANWRQGAGDGGEKINWTDSSD